MEASEAADVLRARDGDREAFRLLVERHTRRVFRLAYRMTGNTQDAEEVVQETFLKAFQQLHRFEQRASFSTWLHRIAANCSVDLLRSRVRFEDHHSREPMDEDRELKAVPSPGPSLDRIVWSAEVRDRVNGAMATLTGLERAAFVLRHFEGWSIDEIGRHLGLRSNATKHSIFRAVRKVRAVLQPVVSEAPDAERKAQGTA